MNKILKPTVAITLAISVSLCSTNVFAGNSKFFSDVNEDSYGWASESLDQIAAKGIVKGIGGTKYSPASLVKRGDFAIFLDKTMNYKSVSDSFFILTDVPADSYYYQSIINCKYYKAIADTNNYYPEDNIRRIDAISMIYNALNSEDYLGGYATTDVSKYADGTSLVNVKENISVGTLTKAGIISGSGDGNLHPYEPLTRAELAVIMAKTDSFIIKVKADRAEKAAAEKKKAEEEAAAKVETENKSDAKVTVSSISSGNVKEKLELNTGSVYSVKGISLEIDNQGDKAIDITNGTDVNMKDSGIRTNKYPGIALSGNSKLSAENVSIISKDTNAITVESGSEVKADKLTINGENMAAISANGGNVSLAGSTVKSSSAPAFNVSAGSIIDISNSVLDVAGRQTDIFNIVSDPENTETPLTINLKDCVIKAADKVNMFFARESTADIVIENSDIDVARFVNSPYIKNEVQKNGNKMNITIKDSNVKGDIYMDHKSELGIDIQSGGYYKGTIDTYLYAKAIDIHLSADGKLELQNDIYVRDFIIEDFNFNNIIDNGFCIYYDDTRGENYELYGDTYTLTYGGQILPK